MASNLVPNYEVKLLLKASEVLGSDNKPKDAVKSALSLSSGATKMSVQFLDTNNREFSDNRWNLRIRKMEDAASVELTYKRRYPLVIEAPGPQVGIQSSNAIESDMQAVVATAASEGFGLDNSFEPQWEVGYQKLTLSLSNNVTPSTTSLSGMDLPHKEASCELLKANSTKEFANWQSATWSTDGIDSSRIYGPILARRWKGKFNGTKLAFEVWPIKKANGLSGTEQIVEASFKTDDFAQGLSIQKELQALLESKGWFLAEDSLKTALIMDRY